MHILCVLRLYGDKITYKCTQMQIFPYFSLVLGDFSSIK
nr:MAG TPA: hypothetical protein [Caudoviricetes sp.]